MKYVIFKGHGSVNPVLFAEHTSHAQVKLEGCQPISAGFVAWNRFGPCQVFGKSDSLNLENRGDEDLTIIRSWYMNSGIYAFLDYEGL